MARPLHSKSTNTDLGRNGIDRQSHVPADGASTWLVAAVALALWRRFRTDSRAVAPAAWRAWWRALGIGLALTLIFAAALVALVQWLQGHGLQAWDLATLQWVAAAGPLSFANAITWQAPGDLLFQPIFVVAFVAFAVWQSRPLIAASMAAAYALAFALIWTGWGLWNRSRPNVIAGGIAAPGLHSFPSGHAVLTVAIYGLVTYLWVRASRSWLERILAVMLCVVWTALVGTARLALGSHWPSDVIGGSIMGLAWLAVVIVALRSAERLNETSARGEQQAGS